MINFRTRRLSTALLGGLLMIIPTTTVAAAPVDPAGEGPTLLVNTRKPIGTVSAELTGANNDTFWDDSKGLWDAEAGAPNADALAKIVRAGVGTFRFPGGTPANEFDWKKSIGPVADRPCQAHGAGNGGPGPITTVAYGLDEYLQFTAAAGATPEIMVPFANETPADAADWVEYLNAEVGDNPNGGVDWARRRAENGHPEPYGVQRWEIGNEVDRGGQQDWRQGDPADPADVTEVMELYAFGGSQEQVDQVLTRGCDRRPRASDSTGEPGQELTVRYPPVAPDSQQIRIGGEPWTAVDDLAGAGPDDRVYAFDPETGTVTFGDGVHGAVPPAGAPIRADYTTAEKPGYVDFRAAMKAVDPSITVYTTWAPIREPGLGTASFPKLMAERGLQDQWDGIAIHPYTNFGVQTDDDGTVDRVWETSREGHDQYMVGDVAAAQLVDDLRAEVGRHGPGKPVVVSEFGALWFGGQDDISAFPHWETAISHALYMASQWAHYSQDDLDWVMGNTLVSDPKGLRAVLGGRPQFVFTPDAVMREQWAPLVHGGGDTVTTSVDDNPMITAIDPPTGPDRYPALVSTAAVGRDGKLRIAIVNRHPDTAITTKIVPAGYSHRGDATVTTVAGDSYLSYNSVDDPDAVGIETAQVDIGRGAFEINVAAHSSTIITLSR